MCPEDPKESNSHANKPSQSHRGSFTTPSTNSQYNSL